MDEPSQVAAKVKPTASSASIDDLLKVYKAATPCISPDAIANQTGIDKEKVCKCLKALGEIGIINPICIAAAGV